MMESNDNIECIDHLKLLFFEHFGLKYSDEIHSNELFNECKLNFNTMSQLIQKWIKQITLNNNINSKNDERFITDQHELFSFNNMSLNLTEDNRTANSHELRIKYEIEDRYSSLISPLITSTNESDEDSLYKSDFQKTPTERKNKKNNLKQNIINDLKMKNNELESEIIQLRTIINDLKNESQNAEDLNNQIGNMIQGQLSYNQT